MKNILTLPLLLVGVLVMYSHSAVAQITVVQDYKNNHSATIGTYHGVKFREAGFSALYAIPGTNGKEFWVCSDRGVNVDAGSANTKDCRPTYDKIFSFPSYAPKIHRIRLMGDSIQILETISMKRPHGTTATGVINPTGFGSTATEVPSTDVVTDCADFNSKTVAKDEFGIDSEGILVDKDGFFWICEEGGPTIWKLNRNGVVVKRFTPYANLKGANSVDVQIDTVFKYRKNNRGFEAIALTPNGKIYAIIQSPILFPNKSAGENTQVHRMIEIDPKTNKTRMLVYMNDGIIGTGSDQIRLRDWKVGDMCAINDTTFLVLEAAARGVTDIKRLYKISITKATAVTSGLYGTKTLEELVDANGLKANGIVPVKKTLVMDLLANGWDSKLDKAEGLAIINDSTIAICNDNDYGQYSPDEDGIPTATGNLSHVVVYRLKGANKLQGFEQRVPAIAQGVTGPSTSTSPYIIPMVPGASVTSILTAGDKVGGYTFCGVPDGSGYFDNGDGTFTMVINQEFGISDGIVRAHGSKGAFISRWVINKSDLSVVSGRDQIETVMLWNGTGYDTYNASNPGTKTAFNRFCSADLPAMTAFYNPKTGMGTMERIFMNGEESGSEGRAFGHIITGKNSGTTYELPYLGKLSFENSVANPFAQDKTIVAGLDDATPGQIYIYIGTKTDKGNEIEMAGLSGGKLFGVSVKDMPLESNGSIPAANTAFTLVDLGQVQNLSGAEINTNSNNAGVTSFLRPEDGAWDPSNPNDFYFVTTNSFSSPSRLWRLHFNDITRPEMGGTATALLDGTEGPKMMDNLTIDNAGNVLIQEDPGNQSYVARMWRYNIAADIVTPIAMHDSTRFAKGGGNFLTQDEESSGIIDAQSILGKGMFLAVDQAHYSIPGEIKEGGQLFAIYLPFTAASNPEISVMGNGRAIDNNSKDASSLTNAHFGKIGPGLTETRMIDIMNSGDANLVITDIYFSGKDAKYFSLVAQPSLPLSIAPGKTYSLPIAFSATAERSYKAMIHVINTDFDESMYSFSVAGSVQKNQIGRSTAQSPYLLPSIPEAHFTSILTAGDKIGNYTACGIMDGLGAFDNGDGSFTLVMNHELGNSVGVPRAHGSTGAFVSKWVINKSDLSVIMGGDLIQHFHLWNGTGYDDYNMSNPSSKAAMNRFCSADMAETTAFYDGANGLGTEDRIFLNGEEAGNEGRAFAHIVTGSEAGHSYELPYLGKFSWENAVASPTVGPKTVVVGLDDATPGQIYVYVGNKKASGSVIEKAGLTGGKLFGVAVNGMVAESNGATTADNTAFTLVDLGQVNNLSGTDINTNSNNAGVTTFLRPEDGAWDPANPNDFYFVTTNSFSSPSRLWRLRFTNAANPELGGTISAVLDGTEGPKMMDNLTIDHYGHVLIQEDPGNQTYLARIWQYSVKEDKLIEIAEHDSSRFQIGGSNFLTTDEESSGILDVQKILGAGMFLLVDQSHYKLEGELAEGGQLLAYFNPDTYKASLPTNVSSVNGNQTLRMFPNPANDRLTLELSLNQEEKVSIEIIDMQGRVISHTERMMINGLNRLDLSTESLSEGVYMVKMSSDSLTETQRLVIRK